MARSDTRSQRNATSRVWRAFLAGLGAARGLAPSALQVRKLLPLLRPFALGALIGSLLVAASLLSANPPRAAPSAAVASASGSGTLGGGGAGGVGARGASDWIHGGEGVVTSNAVTISSSGGALDAADSLPGLSEGFGMALTDLEQRDPTLLALQVSNRQLAALTADVAQWRVRSGASMDGVIGAAREELHSLLAAAPSSIQHIPPSSLPLLLRFLRSPDVFHQNVSALSAALAALLPIQLIPLPSLTAAAAAAAAAASGKDADIFRKLFEYVFWLRPYVALFRSIPTPTLSRLSPLRLSSLRSSLSLQGRQAAATLNAARSSLLSSLRILSSRCGVNTGSEFWTDMHDSALQRYRWVAESAFDKWCVDWAAVGGDYRQRVGLVAPGEMRGEWKERERVWGGWAHSRRCRSCCCQTPSPGHKQGSSTGRDPAAAVKGGEEGGGKGQSAGAAEGGGCKSDSGAGAGRAGARRWELGAADEGVGRHGQATAQHHHQPHQ
ncbi:hypothetical protein CLOP_g10571 [Closterium sp. NIES-67]|nr:hypothetical protein CLOP_g10571 [Closterium sp. NIES-67]